jgi:hypothetical protein
VLEIPISPQVPPLLWRAASQYPVAVGLGDWPVCCENKLNKSPFDRKRKYKIKKQKEEKYDDN